VAATNANSLLDGSRSGTQPPRIAIQRILNAGQVNVSCRQKFSLPFDDFFLITVFFTKVKIKGLKLQKMLTMLQTYYLIL
jgi:hypothetical protein